MTSIEYPKPIASIQHRLGGKAVDFALSLVTFSIGWLIWSMIVWGQGQTPGKQLLKLRVYDKTTGRPAKWGHMAIREFGLSVAAMMIISLLFVPISIEFQYPLYIGIPVLILVLLTLFFLLLDPIWIFRLGKRNRLTDIIVKTDVLNESPDPR